MSKINPTTEQSLVLDSDIKNLIVSASAGSGKTWVMVQFICKLICEKKVPVKRLLVLTFTKAAASEMKERILKEMLSQPASPYIYQQLDDLTTADVSTIDAFCESLIKRNIDKLDLDEDFGIIDESKAEVIKKYAYEMAVQELSKTNISQLNEVMFDFRKNKDLIFEAIQFIESFFASRENEEELLCYFKENQEQIYLNACDMILSESKLELNEILNEIDEMCANYITNQRLSSYLMQIKPSIQELSNQTTLISLYVKAKEIAMVNIPTLKNDERDEVQIDIVKDIKEQIKSFCAKFDKFNFEDSLLLNKMKNGDLSIALLDLYTLYKRNYSGVKAKEDCLDFADLEKFSLKLIQDEETLKQLQSSYDYIFIDEYQDTNFLQEALLKPISHGGHFVGIGDPKQGIYGFRNATMEIMQKDIQDSVSEVDADVIYLRGNFRSDGRILNFVNAIFKNVMKNDNVGIDYASTSMLKSEVEYLQPKYPSVRVDVIKPETNEKTEKSAVYSVKNSDLNENIKNKLEVNAICARIDDMLMQKVYDSKMKLWRDVEPRDIVVLMRSRGKLMASLNSQLTAKGYPVISDQKQSILENSEIQMLLNLLLLTMSFDDDISLVSVLASKIGGFTLEELANIAKNDGKNYCEKFQNESSDKKTLFLRQFNEFKTEIPILGLRKSLINIFDKAHYLAYIENLSQNKVQDVHRFLSFTDSYAFDVAGFIDYIKNMGKSGFSSGEANAISLTTIHASKGLEYPIVVLAGCGEPLEAPSRKSYDISTNYGLGTNVYNSENFEKCSSPQFEAIKLERKKRERVDEIMIFYVALTRAQNHLNLIGTFDLSKTKNEHEINIFNKKSYFDLVFSVLGKDFSKKLEVEEVLIHDEVEFNSISEVEEIAMPIKESFAFAESYEVPIADYLNFNYQYKNSTNLAMKNSVTGIVKIEEQSLDEQDLNKNLENRIVSSTVDEGNAYHKLLKLIDFNLIENFEDLEKYVNKLKELSFITDDELALVDFEILLKNILILNKLTKNHKIFKEKSFIMLSNVNFSQDEVLIQGAVDLFALGEENILVDYKFSSIKNESKLIEKYSKQLELYQEAIEKAFGVIINKKYILSLKFNKLIEIN